MDVPTANTFERVLEVRSPGGGVATAFTIERHGRDFLVTAAHVLPAGIERPTLSVSNRRGDWELQLQPLRIDPATADVAVALLEEGIAPTNLPLPQSSDGIFLGRQVFFMGFPLGMATTTLTAEHRIAFVKGGRMAAMTHLHGVKTLYIDGMCNPGFSGGPVIFNHEGNSDTPRVCGVLSGYVQSSDPREVGANTGIIAAVDIVHVTNAIDAAFG